MSRFICCEKQGAVSTKVYPLHKLHLMRIASVAEGSLLEQLWNFC